MRPSSRALVPIVRDLLDTRDGATYFAERLWGVSLRYDLGEPHPLAGRSCPDFELEDGARLGTLLRDGSGLLLDFGRQASLQALDGRWGDHVRYVAKDAKDRLGLSAVLVRPDGFVAWASDSDSPAPEQVSYEPRRDGSASTTPSVADKSRLAASGSSRSSHAYFPRFRGAW